MQVTVSEDMVLQRLFSGFPISKNAQGFTVAPTPLTDFHPRPLLYSDVHHISKLMVEAVPCAIWRDSSIIVGTADRAAGSVLHVMAAMTACVYSLMNFYPKGPRPPGSIFVAAADPSINGPGDLLINGLKKGDSVVLADVVIRGGNIATKIIDALQRAGVNVTAAVFGADYSDRDGLKAVGKIVPAFSVGTFCLEEHGEPLKTTQFKRNLLAARLEVPSREIAGFLRANEMPATRPLHTMPASFVENCFSRCLAAWVGVPVYSADSSAYPYSCFDLTDMTHCLAPSLVEDTADALCYLSPLLRRLVSGSGDTATTSGVGVSDEYIIVSESDRGGGPLAAAIARRTGISFTMANWYSEVDTLDTAKSSSAVGYSTGATATNVTLYLNGIKKDQKIIVVDDMLSSGGTCEGLLKAIDRAGGKCVECLFASEKTTTKGRERLLKQWKDLKMYSVCFFSSGSEKTVEAHPDAMLAHETPIQSFAGGSRRERNE